MATMRAWRDIVQTEAKYLRELLERAPAGAMQSPAQLATWLVGCGVHVGMSEGFVNIPAQTKRKRVGRIMRWATALLIP